jgi:sulfatase modifying factor 1
MDMRRALSLALITILWASTACGGAPASAPTPRSQVMPPETLPSTVTVPTVMEVLPTPTPVPPPPTPTLAPSPETTAAPQTTTGPVSETAMIAIPAGEFTMGRDDGDDDERPAHTVFLDAFEIDRTEVTNEQFQQFVDQSGYLSDAEQAGESYTWRNYAQDKPQHPVVLVTWSDAVAYCEWLGKRLPSEAEWEKAAKGTEGFAYPWGDEWALDKANTEESGCRGTTIVGSFPQGASPYGVMDMAGNVAEWTTDWYEAYPGSTFASPYFGKKYRVIRGGGWFSEAHLVRTTERSASSEDLRNDDVGFRCVR